MKIVTDCKGLEEPKDPAACNIFALYKLFAAEAERAEMTARYRAGGMGYGEVKKALSAKFEEHFAPFRSRREVLQGNPDHVDSILRRGAERARAEAEKTLRAARRAVGLD